MLDWIVLLGWNSIVIISVLLVVLSLLIWFISAYVNPAKQLAKDLQLAINEIGRVQQENAADSITNTAIFNSFFFNNLSLANYWEEYKATLHQQQSSDRQLIAYRATVSADSYFNTSIADTKLNTEFFKHLPGILTGIGIIGTFIGIIFGLGGFTLETINSEALSQDLRSLMSGVTAAFVASAVAISAAMLVTGIEKSLLNKCYTLIEDVAQKIDSLYHSGTGEEYLQELLESSLQNQSHAAALKDVMVNELRTMLQNLGDTIAKGFSATMQEQMNLLLKAQQQTNQDLAIAIQQGMKEPLEALKEAVARLAGKQEKGVTDLLNNAIEKIEQMFGAKLTEFGQLLNSASEKLDSSMARIEGAGHSMHEAGDKLHQAGSTASQSLESASKQLLEAGTTTATKISEAGEGLTESSALLKEMAVNISNATDNIKLVVTTAGEVATQLNNIKDIFGDLAKFLENFKGATAGTARDLGASQESLDEAIAGLTALTTYLSSGIVEPIQKALQAMERIVVTGANDINKAGSSLKNAAEGAASQITDAGSSLANNLSGSASGIEQAATKMKQSADGWQGISTQMSEVNNNLTQTANNLGQVSANVTNYLALYEQHSSNLTSMVENLNGVVASIEQRNQLGEAQVQQMTNIVAQIKEEQQKVTEFSEQVGNALGKAYDDFATHTSKNIVDITREHQLKLNEVAKQLNASIQDLDDVFGDFAQKIGK